MVWCRRSSLQILNMSQGCLACDAHCKFLCRYTMILTLGTPPMRSHSQTPNLKPPSSRAHEVLLDSFMPLLEEQNPPYTGITPDIGPRILGVPCQVTRVMERRGYAILPTRAKRILLDGTGSREALRSGARHLIAFGLGGQPNFGKLACSRTLLGTRSCPLNPKP